jgi:hypothetical protein
MHQRHLWEICASTCAWERGSGLAYICLEQDKVLVHTIAYVSVYVLLGIALNEDYASMTIQIIDYIDYNGGKGAQKWRRTALSNGRTLACGG